MANSSGGADCLTAFAVSTGNSGTWMKEYFIYSWPPSTTWLGDNENSGVRPQWLRILDSLPGPSFPLKGTHLSHIRRNAGQNWGLDKRGCSEKDNQEPSLTTCWIQRSVDSSYQWWLKSKHLYRFLQVLKPERLCRQCSCRCAQGTKLSGGSSIKNLQTIELSPCNRGSPTEPPLGTELSGSREWRCVPISKPTSRWTAWCSVSSSWDLPNPWRNASWVQNPSDSQYRSKQRVSLSADHQP